MFDQIVQFIEATQIATAIREGDWLFPEIEAVHVLAVTMVFGSISMLDFRLINLSLRGRDVAELELEILPWTWGSFLLAVITGSLLFSSAAHKYVAAWPFELKMCAMALAGLNMVFFNFVGNRDVVKWGRLPRTPVIVQLSGGLSLLLWTIVVICGRWTGFIVK